MAYTKIFAIRRRLDDRVKYAIDGEKTELDAGIAYAVNPEKTKQVRFVKVLNCNDDNVFDAMRAVKRKFKKAGGVLGYHIIQSFAPGEVTPEQAHEIGIEFARRMFGNDYQVVIGTHLDKAHPHNHIIVNSVSFVDGHKYHSSPESYYNEVRATSDELCRENDLSVIAPQGKGKHYGEWKAEQDGKPTIRGMIRADMDVIAEAYTLDTFFMLLERKGYTVHRRGPHRKYTTVQTKGAKRAIRLSSLGDEYTEEGIKKRLAQQRQNNLYHVPALHTPKKRVKRYRVRGLFFYAQQPKITGFHALYLRYLYLLRRTKRRKQPYRAPFPLRQEAAKFERYQAQFKYLLEQNIKTADELEQRIAALEGEIAALTEQRKPLYQQRKEETDEEAKEQISAEIDRHTAALREKRRELALCLPALLCANCSFLVTDPKGELLRNAGRFLIEEGYDVKVFNLVEPKKSDHYNPFAYLRCEADVLTLIDNLIKNTTPKNASSNDPFWERAELALDTALILYLMDFAPPEEQNLETVLFMIENAESREEDEQFQSPLDMLFQALEEEDPYHVAVKQYHIYKKAAGKTAKSILISAAVRLAAFNIPQYAELTKRDDMDFASLGEKKRAIFCVIPVTDASMNYLVGMLYTQCFQELYHRADEKYNGRLPVPVRVLQDEWANVAQPDSYPRILATCRSYNIGLNIFVQNIQNIKALYEKEYESIIGNCDTLLFLGAGNEPTSLEYIAKLLGKETLDTRTRGQTKGRNGSSSTNYQQAGRELMMIDEIRMMKTDEAILMIRGERPVLDKKYNILKHPNVKRIQRGGAQPYVHHPTPDYALPDLPYQFTSLDNIEIIELEENQHEPEEEQEEQRND